MNASGMSFGSRQEKEGRYTISRSLKGLAKQRCSHHRTEPAEPWRGSREGIDGKRPRAELTSVNPEGFEQDADMGTLYPPPGINNAQNLLECRKKGRLARYGRNHYRQAP